MLAHSSLSLRHWLLVLAHTNCLSLSSHLVPASLFSMVAFLLLLVYDSVLHFYQPPKPMRAPSFPCTCSCLWGLPSEHGWRRWLTHWLGRSLTSLWKRWGWSAKERVNVGLVVACHGFTLLSAKFKAKPGHWRERRMLVCLGRWCVTYALKIIFFSYFSRDMMLLYDYICSSLGWLFQELRLSYPAITQSLNSFVTYNRGWLLAHPKFSASVPFACLRLMGSSPRSLLSGILVASWKTQKSWWLHIWFKASAYNHSFCLYFISQVVLQLITLHTTSETPKGQQTQLSRAGELTLCKKALFVF